MKKKIQKTISAFLVLAILTSCANREKNLQKTYEETKKETESTAKIVEKTYEINIDKELTNSVKTNFVHNSETQKEETKDVQIIKEYYENGNLKSEINKSFSQFSEATKTALEAMREELSYQRETSKYWEDSSNHFYKLLEAEKTISKDKVLSVKKEQKNTLYMFFVGLLLGWLLLPMVWKWFKTWLNRFQPYLQLVEILNKKR